MDVTKAINQIHNQYGDGGNDLASNFSATRSLKFAAGAHIQTHVVTRPITLRPFPLQFNGIVGPFGDNILFRERISDTQGYELK